jgi:hypothetical protein
MACAGSHSARRLQIHMLLDGVGEAVDVLFAAPMRVEILGWPVSGPGQQRR